MLALLSLFPHIYRERERERLREGGGGIAPEWELYITDTVIHSLRVPGI